MTIIGMLGQPVSAISAEIPYLTDLEAARKLAAEQNKIVILYTGRVQFCENSDPKQYFFQKVMNGHPNLAARANRYVVCEQFYFAKMFGPDGRITQQMRDESERLDELYKRYDIRLFYPTVTFLKPDGELLNGPFTTRKELCDPRFSSIDRDCYETLADYANADQPRTLQQAMADLAAAAIRPPGEPLDFRIFQYRHHPKGGQKVLLLDTGLPSDQYELLEAVPFVVRDAAAQIVPTTIKAPNCGIHATGSFEDNQPVKGPVIIRLNGAYFRASIGPVGDFSGAGTVAFIPNEHHVSLQARQRQIADELVRGFRQLRNRALDGTTAGIQLSRRMMREEFERQLCAKVGAVMGFPADRLIVEDKTDDRRDQYRNSLIRFFGIVSVDSTFIPLQFTFARKGGLWTKWKTSSSRSTTKVGKLANGNEVLVSFTDHASARGSHELIARVPFKEMEVGVKLDLHMKLPGRGNNVPGIQTYSELLSGSREDLSKRLEKCLEFAIQAVEAAPSTAF